MGRSRDKTKFIIGIDFDGTIVTSEFPKIGSFVPFFQHFWKALQRRDVVTCLWTCRHGHYFDEARIYLLRYGYEFDYWNASPDPFIHLSDDGKPGRKIFCDLWIDDKAFGAPLTTFHGKTVFDWGNASPHILKYIDEYNITGNR